MNLFFVSANEKHFAIKSIRKSFFEIRHKRTKYVYSTSVFVAFVEDNATMSSIWYFENHVSYFVQNRRK